MTIYLKDPDKISNHFHFHFKGLGLNGSSFIDLDYLDHHGYLSHNGQVKPDRFLFMEFKQPGEEMHVPGQYWALMKLNEVPNCTCWIIQRPAAADGKYGFLIPGRGDFQWISKEALQSMYYKWWHEIPIVEPSHLEFPAWLIEWIQRKAISKADILRSLRYLSVSDQREIFRWLKDLHGMP